MASVVEICNLALSQIGDVFIESPPETSKEAKRCAAVYDHDRRALLRAHDWGFARSRAELAPLSSTPAFGFAVEFQLPSNCLRVLRVVDDPEWAVEGRKILSTGDSLQIIYTADISDPNQFDALFIRALAMRIATNIAYSLAPNKDLVKNLYALFELAVTEARRIGAIESDWKTRTAALEANPWTEARA